MEEVCKKYGSLIEKYLLKTFFSVLINLFRKRLLHFELCKLSVSLTNTEFWTSLNLRKIENRGRDLIYIHLIKYEQIIHLHYIVRLSY